MIGTGRDVYWLGRKSGRWILMMLVCVSFSACMVVSPAKRIVGLWQTDLHGFPVIMSVSPETIEILGQEPLAYSLDDDQLQLANDDQAMLKVEFPSRNVMLQTNISTGEVQRFTRQTEP